MKLRVDQDLCAACGTCVEVCPEVFELEDDIAVVKMGDADIPSEYETACREAADSCPVEAIIIE